GNIKEAFKLNLDNAHFDDYTPDRLSALHFIKLELKDGKGNVLAENFYWRNGLKELDYTALNDLPSATISLELKEKQAVADSGRLTVMIANHSQTVAFGNRIRLVDKKTKARILPVIMSDNYFTLMPGERKWITIEATAGQLANGADILLKQYGYTEQKKLSVFFK
ncbi:MAG TPA: glycoside hydrolase family 2 protein, partial [Niabella sp.]|nr:glycoside hydrolase family 2 protein [Niabella sp.]